MILRRVMVLDIDTEEEISERLDIQPLAGYYHILTRRWRDPCERYFTIMEWEEVWFSKVLDGDCARFKRGIIQLNMQDRARVYPAISDGKPDAYRSIIFVKNADDILVLKMAA